MTTARSTINHGATHGSGRDVWDRLWRHRRAAPGDDVWLRRERLGARWQHAVAAVRAAFGTLHGLRTIELGAGRGDFSALMAGEGAAPTLIDYSEPGLDQARTRFDRLGLTANFVRSDMFDLGNDLVGKFDVAMSLGVVEHFRGTDRTRAIRTHLNVLRPGGVCLISVPNAACLTYRAWKMSLEIRRWWPYGLEIPYWRRELTSRAVRAGLIEVQVVGTGFWQSVGDHLLHCVLGQSHDWTARRSFCDNRLGISLLLIGHRPPETTETRESP